MRWSPSSDLFSLFQISRWLRRWRRVGSGLTLPVRICSIRRCLDLKLVRCCSRRISSKPWFLGLGVPSLCSHGRLGASSSRRAAEYFLVAVSLAKSRLSCVEVWSCSGVRGMALRRRLSITPSDLCLPLPRSCLVVFLHRDMRIFRFGFEYGCSVVCWLRSLPSETSLFCFN